MNLFDKHLRWILGLAIVTPLVVIAIDIIYCTRFSRYLTPVGTSFIFLVALYAYNLNKNLKQIDVQMKCQERYDKLIFEVLPEAKNIRGAEDSYFQRYWTLQFEQFQYYMAGFISGQIYLSWLRVGKKDFDDNKPVGNSSYSKSWKEHRSVFHMMDSRFVKLMDLVHREELPVHAKSLKGYIANMEKDKA